MTGLHILLGHLEVRKQIKDEQWASTLFGPTGVLTTIFHIMDDRRKDSIPKRKFNDIKKSSPEYGTKQINNHRGGSNKANVQSDISFFPEMFSNGYF